MTYLLKLRGVCSQGKLLANVLAQHLSQNGKRFHAKMPSTVAQWPCLDFHNSAQASMQTHESAVPCDHSIKASNSARSFIRLTRTTILNYSKQPGNYQSPTTSYQLSHVWDTLLHTDDRHRKSVLMKASDMKPKRR